MRHVFRLLFCLAASGLSINSAAAATHSFSDGWRFVRQDLQNAFAPSFDDSQWEEAVLPHTARVEALVAGKAAHQWQGICWYRKSFELSGSAAGKAIWLRFEGAMNVAEIWVNGKTAGKFMGGYLPYVVDISSMAVPGQKNVVAVRLDNRDNPITGPKPLVDLDFNLYGGLYRDAELVIKDTLHITDPLLADKVAGGGIFVTYPEVSDAAATVLTKAHVRNAGEHPREFTLRNSLIEASGKTAAVLETSQISLPPGGDKAIEQSIRIARPRLWSPSEPNLYSLRTEVVEKGRVVDADQTRIGIRRIEATPEDFSINGRKTFLRGCNRHQEYPYIGNAVPEAAQYRDALKIKQAGFDYVRLSHYPQSPAFLDACDELGIVVMNCLMGWQYFGKDPAFAELKYRECRELVRRDRNHPCIAFWEVSLNESAMPTEFVKRTHAIAHEEFPGDQMITCGWVKGYDVFIQARQHGGCKKVSGVPCIVSEYGDWEYFAQNAGLEQHLWKDLQPAERNSRQLRGHGEKRLLQQALNFQEAHNDNLKTAAFADGIWVMFDYNRGYAEDIEASGVMDIFRLPKFAREFFRSQRNIGDPVMGTAAQPMTYIANYWTSNSPLEIRVFSNCEEVELLLNDASLERRGPEKDRPSTHLAHPPFVFRVSEFKPGVLRAVGYVKGKAVATHERRTPGAPAKLALHFDDSGKPFAEKGKDAVFTYASLEDANGTTVPDASSAIWFGSTGSGGLVGHNPVLSEAGIASVLLASDQPKPRCSVFALGMVKQNGGVIVVAAGASPAEGAQAPSYEIRYTLDGKEPSHDSPLYTGPLPADQNLRVSLFVGRKAVIQADPRTNAPSALTPSAPLLTGLGQ